MKKLELIRYLLMLALVFFMMYGFVQIVGPGIVYDIEPPRPVQIAPVEEAYDEDHCGE